MMSSKKRPINIPKRALSAYMFFTREQRQIVISENPNASFTDIIKILGNKWNNLSDKEPYDKMAADDKIRYNNEMNINESSNKEPSSIEKYIGDQWAQFDLNFNEDIKSLIMKKILTNNDIIEDISNNIEKVENDFNENLYDIIKDIYREMLEFLKDF